MYKVDVRRRKLLTSPSRNLGDPPSPAPPKHPRLPLRAVVFGRASGFAGHDRSAKAFTRAKIDGGGGDDDVCGGGGGGPPTSCGNTEVSGMGGTFRRRRRRTGLSCVACARDRVCVSVRCACVQVSMRLYNMLSRRARVIDPHCGMRLQRFVAFLQNATLDLYV